MLIHPLCVVCHCSVAATCGCGCGLDTCGLGLGLDLRVCGFGLEGRDLGFDTRDLVNITLQIECSGNCGSFVSDSHYRHGLVGWTLRAGGTTRGICVARFSIIRRRDCEYTA